MKRYFLATIFIFHCLFSANAQGPLFFSFETDSRYEHVKAKLLADSEVKILTDNSQQITIRANNGVYKYFFHEGLLYKILLEKRYARAKAADKAQIGCLDFFKRIDAKVIDRFPLATTYQHIAVQRKKVFRLIKTSYPGKVVSLQLSATFTRHTPTYEFDKYCAIADAGTF